MPELSITAYVILGALDVCPMSGYGLKQFLDTSTRHFWATSYGQIYPELKRLAAAGLVESESEATGDRRRTVYRLTESGRAELAGFVSGPDVVACELRDQMLLRLFYSDGVDPAVRGRLLETMARRHRAMVAELSAIKPVVDSIGPSIKREVLDFGVALHEFCADYYERLQPRWGQAEEVAK